MRRSPRHSVAAMATAAGEGDVDLFKDTFGGFLFLLPSDEFSFVLPYNSGITTFFISVLLATGTSVLLTVVRHLICVYGATVSRGDGVSSTDYLPREDGIIPFFSDLRFMWRFGGVKRRPHVIVSVVGILLLWFDAYAISGVTSNAECSQGKHAVVEDKTVTGVCLDSDPAGNGDAQLGRAATILERQRGLGFPIKGIPGRVSIDAESQVYYPESCGRKDCPTVPEDTVSGCTASEWRTAQVQVLLVSVNTSLNEFRLGPDNDYVPGGWPATPQYKNEFTRVLGGTVGRSYDSKGMSRSAPLYSISQTLRNDRQRKGVFLGGYLDLRSNGFASATEPFTIPEGGVRNFNGPLRYRILNCEKVGVNPVTWVVCEMFSSAVRARWHDII